MQALRGLLVLAVGLVVLGYSPGAWACSCPGYSDPAEAKRAYFESADLVFSGIVSDQRDPNQGAPVQSSGDRVYWAFDVDSVQKGSVSESFEVWSARQGGTCGFVFVVGDRYQVFAHENNGELSTGLCSGTHVLSTGQEPLEQLPNTGVTSPFGAMVMLIGASISVLWLRAGKLDETR
jgi:hypothetical protein